MELAVKLSNLRRQLVNEYAISEKYQAEIDEIGKAVLADWHSPISVADTEFSCQHCGKVYYDTDNKYLNRCNTNKSWCARITCSCKKVFYMTYDYKGNARSFILK